MNPTSTPTTPTASDSAAAADRRLALRALGLLAWGGGSWAGLTACGGGSSTPAVEGSASSPSGSTGTGTPAPGGTTPGGTAPQPPSGELLRSGAMGWVMRRDLDVRRLLIIDGYFEGGRYERYQRISVLSGASASIRFFGYDLSGGGASRQLAPGRYTLLLDGRPAATTDLASAAGEGRFGLDLAAVPPGWHLLDVVSPGSDSTPAWPVWVQRDGSMPEATDMPVTSGTYGLLHGPDPARFVHFNARVPARFVPTERPLAPRETPPFDAALPRSELVQVQWVPARRDDVHRPNRTAAGVWTTSNRQPYFWADLVERLPRLPLLDGPRGRGTLQMPTHLQIGRLGQVYFCDPWRVGKVMPDGQVTTLAGWRHREVPSFWGSPPDLELVGDWSQVPTGRRGFHELWGMAWDERSLLVNDAAIPIDGEKPHLRGPRQFVTDTQNGRVCLIEYAADSRSVPARVTEFATGLSDPWDLVCRQGRLYVSERTAHRISVFDADSGQRLPDLLRGTDLAGVSATRFVFRRDTLAKVRAQPCVAPEGLYLFGDWLYVGSRAMEEIRRVHLVTGALETVVAPRVDDNTMFFKLAVGDGSFGPRGTVFLCSWSNYFFGYPTAYLPDGRQWEYLAGSSRGGPWGATGYPTAVAVGQGRMVCGSSAEGLLVQSRVLPGDAALPVSFAEGARQWHDGGYHLTHGPGGFGYVGLPLPWSVSEPIDSYLRTHGHSR